MSTRTNRRKPLDRVRCWLGLHRWQAAAPPGLAVCRDCEHTWWLGKPFIDTWPRSPRIGLVSPWTLIDPGTPHTYPPDLCDVIVAYPPDDGEDAPYIELAYRHDGNWFITGEDSSRVVQAYQNPLCWLDLADLPPLPESLGLRLPAREAA